MNVNLLKESNFLKKEDAGAGILCTIRELKQENVAKAGADPELKWCLFFDEYEKPMVLNSTNAQAIAKITGSDETDSWHGAKVVLYNDPNVSFAGKVLGGIRIRAPRNRPAPAPAAARPAAAPAQPVTRQPAPQPQYEASTDQPGEEGDPNVPF